MPRMGDTYVAHAGTKAVSGQTILSVPYNAFVDDLVSDLNFPRPVSAGGTGAAAPSVARENLGLKIGTDVQAFDAGLQSIANLTTSADLMIYATAEDTYATATLTPFARTVLDDADAAAIRATIGSGYYTGTSANATNLPISSVVLVEQPFLCASCRILAAWLMLAKSLIFLAHPTGFEPVTFGIGIGRKAL